ncbi:hypothetical protein GCM10028811_17240 [Uliginosibacterium sediminicola]
MAEQLARQIDRAFAADADTQEDGQQLRIGQHFRPLRQQALARAFLGGPIGNGHGERLQRIEFANSL